MKTDRKDEQGEAHPEELIAENLDRSSWIGEERSGTDRRCFEWAEGEEIAAVAEGDEEADATTRIGRRVQDAV